MKYRCTHCSHTFELSERDFQRCPNCFWTTSLVNLEQPSAQKEINLPKTAASDQVKAPFKFPVKLILAIIVLGLFGGFAAVSIQKGYFKNLRVKVPQLPKFKKEVSKSTEDTKIDKRSKNISPDQALKSLSETERTYLARPFQITIPRRVTDDEEAILKKQVTFPAKLTEKPVIVPWKKEDFEKMLTNEQKTRKIQLGWGYERSLIKVFEKNYPAAMKAFDEGDYVMTRVRLMSSLTFPIYKNNRQIHRAVALVILRPFINDVIGKIAILNQYLVGQNYLSEVNAIYVSYQALFPVLELQEWDKALTMITELKNQMNTFEQKPKDQAIAPPPAFAILDLEIQNAIQAEASPKPDAAINLKALGVDLDLKEKVVRSNTADALAAVQKQYQRGLSFIEQGNWEEAKNVLRSIDFPPELVEDARAKLEVIEKMLALTDTDQNKMVKSN